MSTTSKNRFKEITSLMRKYENTINGFNKTYNHNVEELATPHRLKQYNMCLRIWDNLKAKRDQLKLNQR